MRQLTEMMAADNNFNSSYGNVTNREWCNLEVERISKDGTRKSCTKELGDKICIMVDAVDHLAQDYHSARLA